MKRTADEDELGKLRKKVREGLAMYGWSYSDLARHYLDYQWKRDETLGEEGDEGKILNTIKSDMARSSSLRTHKRLGEYLEIIQDKEKSNVRLVALCGDSLSRELRDRLKCISLDLDKRLESD